MESRTLAARVPSVLAAMAIAALAACSNPNQPSALPQTQNPTAQSQREHSQNSQASAFLPGALKHPRDTSRILYDTNPPAKFAMSASKPGAFPPPSFCVAHFGLACYTPALIRTAYNVPSAYDGTGQTIVIVDAYGSPTVKNDLHTFDLAKALDEARTSPYFG